MPLHPPINPDVNDIADRTKYAYAIGTRLIAAVQYRLAKLASDGRLDVAESERLQIMMAHLWEALREGTTDAVRHQSSEEASEDADNTYNDGRQVMTQNRIEPWADARLDDYVPFVVGDGAVCAHMPGTVCHIAAPTPDLRWGETVLAQIDWFERASNTRPIWLKRGIDNPSA